MMNLTVFYTNLVVFQYEPPFGTTTYGNAIKTPFCSLRGQALPFDVPPERYQTLRGDVDVRI